MSLIDKLKTELGAEYEVERELGGGGMSRVFLVHDRRLGRKIVAKVLAEELAANVSLDRFRREVSMIAGLQHPNIVGVLDAGEVDGLPYFTMPFVKGKSLRARLEEGPLALGEVVRLLRDLARGLQFAHEHGIVHRDVKPDNVLITGDAAALADFGVAKAVSGDPRDPKKTNPMLTAVGASLGTPAYMAPEQVVGDGEMDHRADIYAFGATAYELVTGRTVFVRDSMQSMIAAVMSEVPEPLEKLRPDVTPELAALIQGCLAKDPDARPQTAAAVLQALEGGAITTQPVMQVRPLGRRRGVVGAAATVVVLFAAVAVWQLGPSGSVADRRSVAVLPFDNLGGDTADAYFAEGMTDELTVALARVPGLRVASRIAAARFRESDASPEEIGRALNVATLIEGTVRRSGDRLRLTANLVELPGGLSLWSETYERERRDVFEVQDDVANAIAQALSERFGGGEIAVDARPGTDDPDAYDAFLRGRYYMRQRGESSLRSALELFRQSAAIDPRFAEAYAGIADVLLLLPLYAPVPSDSVRPIALDAVNRAIDLNDGLAAAHAARGNLLQAAWRWDEAESSYRRAIELEEGYATAHQWHGELLLLLGRVAEAEAALARAVTLDSMSPVVVASHALSAAIAGEMDRAVTQAVRALRLDPASPVPRFMLGAIHLYRDDPQPAIDQLDAARALVPDLAGVKGLLGYAFAAAGRDADARAMLQSLDSTNLASGNASAIARIHLGLGDLDRAADWYLRAAAARDVFFNSESMASPIFDPLRSHPTFARVIDLVGLDPELLLRR